MAGSTHGRLMARQGQRASVDQAGVSRLQRSGPDLHPRVLNPLVLSLPDLHPLHFFKHAKDGARLSNEKPLEHFGKAAALEGVAAGAGTVSHVMLRNEFAKPEIIASDVTISRAAP
jgi:hypothetical protein